MHDCEAEKERERVCDAYKSIRSKNSNQAHHARWEPMLLMLMLAGHSVPKSSLVIP